MPMLIVANWKAYVESSTKAKVLLASAKKLAAVSPHEIVLAPPSPLLGLLTPGNRSKVRFGAQDVSDSTGGAATGEVTAALLSGMGVKYVIVGHSERRAQGETNEVVASKVSHALAHGLTPIVCIGERERDADATYLHGLRAQLAAVFAPLSQKERMEVVVAYEPIWAIGKTAADAITAHDLREMVLYIRKVLEEYLPGKGASSIRVIYGGSVEPGDVRELASGSGADGFLVGHASADVGMFTKLVREIS
ncbi:MAG: triose-phosphate isomerase [Patescibacteria group bacterium]